jgi:hypothetical protein
LTVGESGLDDATMEDGAAPGVEDVTVVGRD